MTATVYLGIGSNLGDRLENLKEAVRLLAPAVRVTAHSSYYETDPVGYTDQPLFLNACIRGETELSPQDLLRLCKHIEEERQRVATVRWGPRTCDVDILLYGDFTLVTTELIIPHERMQERAFVLVPLAEIAADVQHPLLRQTIGELAAKADGREGVRKVSEDALKSRS